MIIRSIKDDFTFSIIMAIYNTENYINEAIDSLLSQTLDFSQHIQLILVDDGSSDSSLDIALDYQNQFPENIDVISQENQGLGAALNTGLKYIKGKYVNFLDSDDKFSENVLYEVKSFFDKYGDVTDVVSIKLVQFERRTKPHILNFKYEEDKLIDLLKEPFNPQLSVSSAFINANAIRDKRFRTDLHSSVDTNMMTKILLEKKKLGVLKSPTYFYRKRTDNTSMIDSSIFRKDFFTERIKNHYLDIIQYCIDKEGEVPLFIQATLAYSLQWMVRPEIPEFFTDDEKDEFRYYFNKLLSYLSTDVLSESTIIFNPYMRNYFIIKCNGDLHCEVDKINNQATIKSNNITLDRLSNHTVWISNIEIKKDFILITGSFNSMFNSDNLSFMANCEDAGGNCKSFASMPSKTYHRDNISFFSETVQFINCFDLIVPFEMGENYDIKISIVYRDGENAIVQYPKIGIGRSTFKSKQKPYLIKDSLMVQFKDNRFVVSNTEKL